MKKILIASMIILMTIAPQTALAGDDNYPEIYDTSVSEGE